MIVLQSIVLDNMTNGWVDLFINTFEIDTSVTSRVAGEIFSSSVAPNNYQIHNQIIVSPCSTYLLIEIIHL